MEYSLGLSPCPNDTFIFHALLKGLIPLPFRVVPHMADVEELNTMVSRGELMVSKISVGAYVGCMDRYVLLRSGGALGFGCGPLVVAKRPLDAEALKHASVAIPGEQTSANFLLGLTGRFTGPRKAMLFSDVIGAVERGETDLGVIIHEGRFTYERHGLIKVLDLGEWWEETYHLPLPLGAIVARRDMPQDEALRMEEKIAESLRFAWSNPQASGDFIRENAQELAGSVISAHIKTFVTDFSLNLGRQGEEAIERFVGEAARLAGKNLPEDGLFLGKGKA
ncbi:MAG: 1,4-dihydroxy-6-naphthoate synthase [Desulfovibrio sp.]|nr:1,4-dihydroxy-6-naphthoate synthase [Desulfovibrio sp.]